MVHTSTNYLELVTVIFDFNQGSFQCLGNSDCQNHLFLAQSG